MPKNRHTVVVREVTERVYEVEVDDDNHVYDQRVEAKSLARRRHDSGDLGERSQTHRATVVWSHAQAVK